MTAGTKNIGLMLCHNEADVIAEHLAHVAPFVDAIFVLDGSSDGTREVLQAHPLVRRVFLDTDVAPGARVQDHHRQVLLEAARLEFGPNQWFTLLHPDEFFHDDPRRVIALAEAQGACFVNWAAMQFFLHSSDAARNLDAVPSVQERLRWYSPFWIEVRQFKDSTRAAYRAGEHGRVYPRGVGWRPFGAMPVLKHFPYRSVAQMQAKKSAPGFSQGHAVGSVYRQTAQPVYKTAREFGGDFAEFELVRQPGLLGMWWRWWRLCNHRVG